MDSDDSNQTITNFIHSEVETTEEFLESKPSPTNSCLPHFRPITMLKSFFPLSRRLILPLFFPLSQAMHPMYEALSKMSLVNVGGDQGGCRGVLGDPYVLK